MKVLKLRNRRFINLPNEVRLWSCSGGPCCLEVDLEKIEGVGAAGSSGRSQPAEVPLADSLGLVGGHDFANQVKYV